MESLRETLARARSKGVAVGHFNVSDLVLIKAVVAAARELSVPVIIGASEGEREFLGTAQLAAVVRSLRDEQPVPLYLNADHTHSLVKALEAARAGFDSVVFDLSSLPLEDNIKQTKQAVEALKSIRPDIIVEGEIGDIGSGSEIHAADKPVTRRLTTTAEAVEFARATGIDVLAPAVGNSHGMLQSMVDGVDHKHLAIDRIREIAAATGLPLTLHGGSGTADEDLLKAICAGVAIVHINTELRVAWRRGLAEELQKRPQEVVPYKLLPAAVTAVQQVVGARLRLLNQK
jgi:fructose-bisphosphate aldolase class II